MAAVDHRRGRFEPVVRECRTVMEKAGVIDLTSCGKFELRGRDAARLLDRLTAGQLPAVSSAVSSHLLTASGRVYAEMTVARLDDQTFFCITGAASELHDLRCVVQMPLELRATMLATMR